MILTRYIPEPKWGKRFLRESSLCFTVDLTQRYFIDHREIIHTLNFTGERKLL